MVGTLAAWGLVVLALCAPAARAGADPTLGSPAVIRLWLGGPGGPAPACTAAYVSDPLQRLPPGTAWLLTARHCAEGGPWHAGRESPGPALAIAEWRPGLDLGPWDLVRLTDIAAGRVRRPAGAPSLAVAPSMPRAGSVWIHGFAFGVEHITAGRILGDSALRPGSVEMKLVTGPQTEVGPGFSGAPVLDARGRLIGLLWALRSDGERDFTGFVIPAETIREALERLPPR